MFTFAIVDNEQIDIKIKSVTEEELNGNRSLMRSSRIESTM